MLVASDWHDGYLQHAGALALANIGDGAMLEALSTHPSHALRVAALMALRRMEHAGGVRLLADADEHIVTDGGTVHHGVVPHRNTPTERHRNAVVRVEDHVVLHIGIRPDDDRLVVAPQHRAVPDAGALGDLDRAHECRRWGHPRALSDLGSI
jgi:hypothetical protein